MPMTEAEFEFLYVLYRAKERGEYLPLSRLTREVALSGQVRWSIEVRSRIRNRGRDRYPKPRP